MTVKWPTDAVDKQEHDLEEPLTTLLKDLNLTGPYDTGKGPIESNTLELTTQVKRSVAGAGGIGGIASVAGGLWAALSKNGDTSLAIAVVAGGAFVLGMAVLAYAKILDADIRGRAAATTERFTSLATIASQYLRTASKYTEVPANGAAVKRNDAAVRNGAANGNKQADADGTEHSSRSMQDELRFALAAFSSRVSVASPMGDGAVEAVEWAGEKLRLKVAGDVGWIGIDDATSFAMIP